MNAISKDFLFVSRNGVSPELRIFRNIANLRKAEEKYPRISIQRELSREDMEVFHSKIDEAKEKNMTRTDKFTYFVVSGLPSKWEI